MVLYHLLNVAHLLTAWALADKSVYMLLHVCPLMALCLQLAIGSLHTVVSHCCVVEPL